MISKETLMISNYIVGLNYSIVEEASHSVSILTSPPTPKKKTKATQHVNFDIPPPQEENKSKYKTKEEFVCEFKTISQNK